MMWDERSRAILGTFLFALTACSAGKGQDASGGDGGTGVGGASGTSGAQGGVGATGIGGGAGASIGGSSASGGVGASSAAGGLGATGGVAAAGLGGTAASAATGGVSGAGAVPGDSGAGGMVACQDLSVVPTPLVPTVLILVDNSSSMFETQPPAWPILHDALMSPVDGPVKALEGKIHFGFVSYKGSTVASTEASPSCADMTSRVTPALGNHAAIEAVYSAITWSPGTKWETPTGHAITVAADILAAFNPNPPGPKYILLVTDGNPNTCATLDPQCGQDFAIRAAQQAFNPGGIRTLVFGIGDIVAQPNNGCPVSGRCGLLHLQDMANAGAGLPVQAAPDNFKYEACNIGQLLVAGYAQAGQTPGAEPYFTGSTRAELLPRLTSTLTNVVSCTIDLDATISATADPGLAHITLGGTAVPYNMTDGWILEPNRHQITLQGAACATFRGGATVNVVFPCSNGRPIGM